MSISSVFKRKQRMIQSAIALGDEKQIQMASVCRTERMFPFWNAPVFTLSKTTSSSNLAERLNVCLHGSLVIEKVNVDEKRQEFLAAIGAQSFEEIERSYKLAIVTILPEGIEVSFQQPASKKAHGFVAESMPRMFPGAAVSSEIAGEILSFLQSPPNPHHERDE